MNMRFNGRPPRRAQSLPSLAAMLRHIADTDAPARKPPHPRPKGEFSMRDLNYDLKQLCRHNRDGSYATQADREHILDLIADQLYEMGFRGLRAHGLKPKHIEKLVERWLTEKRSPGTIKNRMATLRWAAQKLGKENIVARSNAAYGVP